MTTDLWDECVEPIAKRLEAIAAAVTRGPEAVARECSMSIPARPDRDADLVLSNAARLLRCLRDTRKQLIPKGFDTPQLRKIAQRLRTQDNRCTRAPIFQVRGRRRIYGMDPAYGGDDFEWISTVDDFIVVDPPEDEDDPPEGVEKLYYILVEEVLAVAFTKEGCEEHLRQNRHNYRGYDEVFIYADAIWRCPEMIAIRKALLSLPEPEETP